MVRRLKDGRISVYTYDEGWNRLLRDHKWHSAQDLGAVVGDVLVVTNRSTKEKSEWRVTSLVRMLSETEAKLEWEAEPFLTRQGAKGFDWFPYVLEKLERVS